MTAMLLQEGLAHHRAGDLGAAEAAYRRVLDAAPDQGSAIRLLALVQVARAEAHLRAGAAAPALVAADAAIALQPALAAGPFLRGTALRALGRPAEAASALDRAVALAPDHADAWLNLGNARADLGDLDGAEAHLRVALARDPALAEAHASLGWLLTCRGRLAEGMEACEAALALRPDFAQAHWNLSTTCMLAGDWARGWEEYEWRKLHPRFGADYPGLPGEEWTGGPLAGRTLLVHAEQGLGDTIQFARYLPLLVARGARVVLACARPLIALLRQLPVEVVDRAGRLPPYDLWVDQMSLPRLFGTRPDSVPAAGGYLRPGVGAEAGRAGGIGVVWAGNPAHSNDANRSMPTRCLSPLVAAAGERLVSLQVGPRSGEIADLFDIPDRAASLPDFAATARLVAGLDLVIAVDTSTAHLAGALGKEVWLMLPHAPDWRWLLGRDDTPWYARMRLFRQARPGDWDGVIDRVVSALG